MIEEMSHRSLKLVVLGWRKLVHFIGVGKVDFASSSDIAGVVKLTSACGGGFGASSHTLGQRPYQMPKVLMPSHFPVARFRPE
jgi:hypothetical protein